MEVRLRQGRKCLSCGYRRAIRAERAPLGARRVPAVPLRRLGLDAELSERTRRLLRERPVDRRRLRPVVGGAGLDGSGEHRATNASLGR